MSKSLVAYFSASGQTARLAKTVADAADADLFEIVPVQPYTDADLNWNDAKSRSSIEMNDPSSRPAIASKVGNMDSYDIVYVGFPIWWYIAPTIINTFLESYDLAGKTIVPFATSGGSGMGSTSRSLEPSAPGATVLEGRRFSATASKDQISQWIESLAL